MTMTVVMKEKFVLHFYDIEGKVTELKQICETIHRTLGTKIVEILRSNCAKLWQFQCYYTETSRLMTT